VFSPKGLRDWVAGADNYVLVLLLILVSILLTRDHPGVITEQTATDGSHGRCKDDETRHAAKRGALARYRHRTPDQIC